jgi:hypothetical protein
MIIHIELFISVLFYLTNFYNYILIEKKLQYNYIVMKNSQLIC